MKFKGLSLLALLCLFSGKVVAQAVASDQKAMDQLEQLSSKIVSENPAATLSTEQKSKILELYKERLQKLEEINASTIDKDEKKEQRQAITKSTNQEIRKNILTTEQRQALKAANDKNK